MSPDAIPGAYHTQFEQYMDGARCFLLPNNRSEWENKQRKTFVELSGQKRNSSSSPPPSSQSIQPPPPLQLEYHKKISVTTAAVYSSVSAMGYYWKYIPYQRDKTHEKTTRYWLFWAWHRVALCHIKGATRRKANTTTLGSNAAL